MESEHIGVKKSFPIKIRLERVVPKNMDAETWLAQYITSDNRSPEHTAAEDLGPDNTELVDMEIENTESESNIVVYPTFYAGGTPWDLPAWLLVFNARHIRKCRWADTCHICIDTYALLEHEKTCNLGSTCRTPNCFVYARCVRHYVFCANENCPYCMNINEELEKCEIAATVFNFWQAKILYWNSQYPSYHRK